MSLQVHLQAGQGQATILLRAHHAPSVRPPGEPPPLATPARPLSDLRRFRMPHVLRNGHSGLGPGPGPGAPGGGGGGGAEVGERRLNGACSRLRRLLQYEPHLPAAHPHPHPHPPYVKREPDDVKREPGDMECDGLVKLEGRVKIENGIKPENGVKGARCGSAGEASALAAAIIARAVLFCRASLYPGLHTIIAPPSPRSPRPARAACAWCLRAHGAARCLWYPPPAPLEPRAWRRLRGARYLCACCGDGDPPPAPAPVPDPAEVLDEGGWYGKGYRKGRRKRR